MTRRGLATMMAAVLMLAAVAAARAAVTYFGLTFPDRVADAQIGTTNDFEAKNPGLGYGVRYQKPGWAIDIYIYDLGRPSIPDDVGSDALKAQLEQAQGDVFEQQKRGVYAQVKVTGSYVVKDGGGRARFRCEDFNYVRQPEGNVDSFLCLTGWNNKFVKFRLTTRHDPRSGGETRRFMEAWLKILWP
jgi:hypothetical protein